ncbi:MAG: hypothetical protein V2I51_10285, partial [Anderseniella sp.]|nr:hypothetical protein [Anderseniella sp.]
ADNPTIEKIARHPKVRRPGTDAGLAAMADSPQYQGSGIFGETGAMRVLIGALIAVLLGTFSAFAASPEAQELIDRAAADCRTLNNGEFDAGDAVAEIELRSQFGTVVAELVDESKYACSSAASLYCGTGGCMLNLIVDDTVRSWQATGWRLIEWGPDRILLIGRDGGWCGGAGAEVCYEALVWSNGKILTVGPAPESR